MATTTFSTLSSDAVTYIRDELLDIAEKNVVLAPLAMQATLPQHNSKTIQFSRYPRLALPMTAATEGTTPDTVALAVETVQAVVDQWILIVALTDLSVITVKHPLVPIVTELLGLVQAELVDREIQKVLNAGSSVTFANSRASRATLTSTDTINATEVRKLFALMSRNGARRIGKTYAFVVDPEVGQDISNEDQFLSAHQLAQATSVFNNEIGTYLGFSFMVSNYLPTVTLGTAGDWTFVFGGTGGTWTDGWIANGKIEAINSTSGLVEKVYAVKTDTEDGGAAEKLTVTVPSTAGYLYNVYVSAVNNSSTDANMVLVAEAQSPSTAVVVSTQPTATTVNKPQALPPSGVTVHTSYVLGKDAFGMVKLSGDNLRVMMTDGKPSDSDPAAQRRKISVKGSFKALILNSDWYRRFESASAF